MTMRCMLPGVVAPFDVKLVESTIIETFEPGDKVKSRDILLTEMRDYLTFGSKGHDKMLLHEDRIYTISENHI